jgi:PAS domain S-box-containing protein
MSPIAGILVVALIEAMLAAMVLARNPRRPVNRWFAAFAASLALWGTMVGLRRLVDDPSVVIIMVRLLFAVAVLIPVTFFRFAMVFPRPGRVRSQVAHVVTLTGLFISGLAFSPWIVSHMRPRPAGFPDPVYGILYPVFAVYFVTCSVTALIHLGQKLSTAKGFARAQLQYMFLGAALAMLGAVTTNIVVPLVFRTSRLSIYGPYFTLILIAFTAHSIVRHRLMDIRVVIGRAAAYGAGWVLASLVVVAMVLLDLVTPLEVTLTPAGAMAMGIVAAIAVGALAPRIRRIADRYLYRPAYDARQLLREGSRAMATFGGPERVAGAIADLMVKALHPESLAILVWQREREEFHPVLTYHVDPTFVWPGSALAVGSPLVSEIHDRLGSLLADDLSGHVTIDTAVGVGRDLRAWAAEVAVPARTEGKLGAILVVGSKLSGDPYFREDFELLETLASQLAVGLENARLYQEVVSIKEYNERILAYMDSGVIAVREDGIVTTFNPAAERLTGSPGPRVLENSLGTLDVAIQRILKDSLAGHQDSETEIGVTRPDGRSLPLLVHVSSLHDRNGNIRGAIAVFNDHSRVKALEEDKRRADRLTAMGALATGIAHEVRNPLVAIKTFAELLPERADDQEFRSTFAKVAVKEIHRIEELLGRLRALAMPTAAALHPLDAQVPVLETVDLLRGEADRRKIRIVTDIAPDLPPILGDADQLKQLFLNLLLNGLDAMGGGGTLRVVVHPDLPRPAQRVLAVRVSDTGPGIPREDQARVFEPFFTTKLHGTGLGLAICRTIADAHRAALSVESEPGVGTSFVVHFPALVTAPVAEALR